MSRFYGDLRGNRGTATRQGTAKSGIDGHIRGWTLGAKVVCFVGEDGEDRVVVNLTGGSSNPSCKLSLGTWSLNADGKPMLTHY